MSTSDRKGGFIIPGYDPTNLSGKWDQPQAFSAGSTWRKLPSAPSSISATTSGNSTVTIGDPTDLGLPATITAYTATASTGGSIVQTITGASSPISFSGLTDGTTYTISATVSNAAGTSPAVSTNITVVVVTGQQAYTTVGTYTWVVPAGVDSVSVVAVGGGGRNFGQGGSLRYGNGISVTAGASITVVVGDGGTNQQQSSPNGDGKNSSFGTNVVAAGGGAGNSDLTAANSVSGASTSGGGNGGTGANKGGGGAGGYSGAGGYGGQAGAGGGGGGGGDWGHNGITYTGPGGGGGVGIMGEGSNGSGGGTNAGGGGGSGGQSGGTGWAAGAPNYDTHAGTAGDYGGAVGYASSTSASGPGGQGAVRIIYGTNRSFPSTNTGDL